MGRLETPSISIFAQKIFPLKSCAMSSNPYPRDQIAMLNIIHAKGVMARRGRFPRMRIPTPAYIADNDIRLVGINWVFIASLAFQIF
jgi:hypothetical protein